MAAKLRSILIVFLKLTFFAVKMICDKTQRKYFLRWIVSWTPGYLFRKKEPWIAFGAIDFLKTYLSGKRDVSVFEYGSGASTFFWEKMGSRVVSVEHDSVWYERMKPVVKTYEKIQYLLAIPEKNGVLEKFDPSDSDKYQSYAPMYRESTFKKYAMSIEEFNNGEFDIVLVDGRARPSCIKHAINKIKKGGLLILDDSERGYYLEKAGDLVKGFSKKEWLGTFPHLDYYAQTTIFVRN